MRLARRRRAAAMPFAALLACLLGPAAGLGQPAAAPRSSSSRAEERTARYFDSVKGDPVALRAFLRAMPKGGDLHTHLTGAIYAESFVSWAAEDALCVDSASLTILRDREPCDAAGGQRAAKEAHGDPAFYALLIDKLSVRNHHPARTPGGYQFFGAFSHFGPLTQTRRGDMLAQIARRAAAQNILYLEPTITSDVEVAREAAAKVEWTDDLATLHARLLDAGLRDAPRTAEIEAAERRARVLLGCGTSAPDPGCGVTIRYQAAALRAFAPVQVFAMLAWAFEQNVADPRFVGINMVQPEDWHVPVRDYDLHMRMVEFLHARYPQVNIALHAGELTLGLVPPEVLGTHIPKAIAQGHARRIGHGTDVVYHPRPLELMAEMKRRDVAVEIGLSSSDLILGVRGDRHPLRSYLRAGVPAVIVTDDEGVARSDLTNEYLRAATEHGLGYRELKRMARDSLRYAFLEDGEKRALIERFEWMVRAFESSVAP